MQLSLRGLFSKTCVSVLSLIFQKNVTDLIIVRNGEGGGGRMYSVFSVFEAHLAA